MNLNWLYVFMLAWLIGYSFNWVPSDLRFGILAALLVLGAAGWWSLYHSEDEDP